MRFYPWLECCTCGSLGWLDISGTHGISVHWHNSLGFQRRNLQGAWPLASCSDRKSQTDSLASVEVGRHPNRAQKTLISFSQYNFFGEADVSFHKLHGHAVDAVSFIGWCEALVLENVAKMPPTSRARDLDTMTISVRVRGHALRVAFVKSWPPTSALELGSSRVQRVLAGAANEMAFTRCRVEAVVLAATGLGALLPDHPVLLRSQLL
eukprot:CAMPEP_0205878710 /NCGR_PEP_ID=MMETSP1083-20121108/14999_1 /ASSEMBLY_ACC=CAM_ASM_000430 /TAXON_ID=97485 /ORGANISM="Prymnesium parvum, Strain Texoma1" /LENGTH=208 /DNA_ID=CAMNT_0053241601 /DNA_START=203 /DNA_END=827 /DNA_ORIENTATION=+